MKKSLVFFLLIVMCAVLTVPVLADVIDVPNNSFLENNLDQCEYTRRSYTINAPEGGTRIYQEPESNVVLATIQNGETFFVDWTYQNEWGIVSWSEGEKGAVQDWQGKYGWIKLSDTFVVYDNLSFTADHSEEFFYDEALSKDFTEKFEPDMTLYFYKYPGAGEWNSTLELTKENYEDIRGNFGFSSFYEDPEGRIWGYVGYYWGQRDWLCLSDPTNDSIPAFGGALQQDPVQNQDVDADPEEQDETEAESISTQVSQGTQIYPAEPIEAYPDGNPRTKQLTLAGILVAAVAAISVGLIYGQGKKKKK